jgi:hypothetical protein
MNQVAPKAQVGRLLSLYGWVAPPAVLEFRTGLSALTRTGARTTTSHKDRNRLGLSEMPKSFITALDGAPALRRVWRSHSFQRHS